jgi:preprotein translocase subunit YajC
MRFAFADQLPPAPTGASQQVATGAPAGAAQQPGPLGMILPFALMFAVIYFLMIRPQQKKMKEHQSLLEKIKEGDEVLTTSGIFGKVTTVADKILTVEIANNVRVRLLKSQVATINPQLK